MDQNAANRIEAAPAPTQATSASRLDALRAQVDDVRDVMTANVERVLARGDRLDELLDKSESLETGASGFRDRARRVERKMCWKNARCNCIVAAVLCVVITTIVIVILYETGVIKFRS